MGHLGIAPEEGGQVFKCIRYTRNSFRRRCREEVAAFEELVGSHGGLGGASQSHSNPSLTLNLPRCPMWELNHTAPSLKAMGAGKIIKQRFRKKLMINQKTKG